MFEMVVTLHFIDNDKLQRDELAQRFFDYTSIQRYKVMETMNKNRSIPQEFRTEEMDNEIEREYNSFLKNYRKKEGNHPRTDTWSGLSLLEMIRTITNNYKKNDFLTGYDIMNRLNNQYLHPTVEYVKNIVKDDAFVKSRHSRPRQILSRTGYGGNPGSVYMYEKTGFPFPDQSLSSTRSGIEDKLHGNDKLR